MVKIEHILTGWKNFIDKSEVVEAVAKERAAICAVCPQAKKGLLLTFLNDKLQEIKGMKCDECGCPLSAKIRSNDKCPLGKWE